MEDAQDQDPFRAERQRSGVLVADFSGEAIPMILGYGAVREAAKAWQTYSSDAPFRVPIPSEEGVRSVRQLPIEADPPLQTAFRDLIKPFFSRPHQAPYQARIQALAAEMVAKAKTVDRLEIVRDFALPLQSRALTYLLGVPEEEALTWMGWGTHVFHDGDDSHAKGSGLEAYIRGKLNRAAQDGGDDFFAFLSQAEVNGAPLTADEQLGIANLVFAGGRDTVITSIARMIAYFADHRAELSEIAEDEKRIALAVEEFMRVISPLTHIGRVCRHASRLGDHTLPADSRISLCWASANADERVFDRPETVQLNRQVNPHVAFGSGVHSCLGAPQARTILRSLIRALATETRGIAILSQTRQYEVYGKARRWVGYTALNARIWD